MSNNKKRLLSLLDILIKESDYDHPISEGELKRLLALKDIAIANRKTIYEDIQTLIDYDYDIQYDTKRRGYYLEEAPFSVAEIKILLDHINSLKDFDAKAKLQAKLLGFISSSEGQLLKNNQFINNDKTLKSKEKKAGYYYKYLDKIACILKAIKEHHYLNIFYNNKEYLVNPYFLYYSNNNYYLYVKFDDSDDNYQFRLDRITHLKDIDKVYDIDNKAIEAIKRRIKTSTNNFNKKDIKVIQVSLNKDYSQLVNRLTDDFPEHYLDNQGNLILEYSVNNILFSKLVSYGDEIKIKAPKEVLEAYLDYLRKIINNY